MGVVLVTGCGGLIGAEASRMYSEQGYDVVGVDNDMRAEFFGPEASTSHNVERLQRTIPGFMLVHKDIRDEEAMLRLFQHYQPDVIVHTAAQPSHDWAARDPQTDFGVNALGTLNLLQAARTYTPDSPFIHCSTSKVYGARPNELPLFDAGDRYDLPREHEYWHGITPCMSVDQTTHSLFGVSKLAADLLVQEYGRYFNMPTVCFRPGCLTGGNHAGTELHGFLSYLMRCTITGRQYTVYGYNGLQVRCNIHSSDLVSAFIEFTKNPRAAAVYNIGGGRTSNCSMREAINLCEDIAGKRLNLTYGSVPRIGDHKWWISDNRPFEENYPEWKMVWRTTQDILSNIYEQNVERWSAESQE